jgi:hypothetical protein
VGAVTSMPNRTPLYVTRRRVAHKPDFAATAACGQSFIPGEIIRLTYAQAFVFVKPSWCSLCFPGGVS